MTIPLRQRVVRAVGASTLGHGIGKIVSLLATLVLARLLTPEDFGLMAIATTVIGFVSFLNEIGLGAALVQRKEISAAEIDGCFAIALAASITLSVVVFGLSWPVAAFFDSAALQPVLGVLGLGFVFGALNTVPVALLQRQLRLQAVMWLGLASAITQALIAIPLAWFGFGYWSLVIGFFAGQALCTIWYWRTVAWRPGWPLSFKAGLGLLDYGLNITYTRVLWHVYMNVDKLIIGKLLGPRMVGLYDVGKSLAGLPTAQISGLVTSVASPVFARLQGDTERLQAVFLRFTSGVAYLTFPALTGMALLAEPLVGVLLGSQWGQAVLPLQALCFSEMVRSVANLQSQMLISTGHVRRLVRYSGLCTVTLPAAIALGAWLDGLRGVAIAWAVVYPLLSLVLLRETRIATGVSYRRFWRAIRQPAMGSVAMAAVILLAGHALAGVAAAQAVELALLVAVGAVAYVAYVIYLDPEGLREIRQVLEDLGVPASRLRSWPFGRVDAGVKGQ